MNLSAIFSKTGKGVQEASGKTSHLSRADRAVLSAIDGKTRLSEVQEKFEKITGPKFEALIQQLDKDGFIREVASGSQAAAPTVRSAAPAAKSSPPKADDGDEALDFTQAVKLPPKAAPAAPKPPPVDLAASARADAERKAKEQQALDYRGRQEAEAKAKLEAEARARAAAQAKARAEAEAAARAEAEAKARAETDAKVKAARDAAVRMAMEAKAKAEAEARATTSAAVEREREALDRARREAEDKARLEMELNAKLEAERKAREDAERRAAEAGDRARKELEEKAKRDAEELRLRLEAEMKAKLDEERKAREAEDRKRREEDDRRRAEEDARRRKEDEARRAKEDAERKAREAEDRKRREEEDRKRREEDERRRREDEARRAKEVAERKAREEEDRKRAQEEAERRAKDDAERRAREEAERKKRDDEERKRREEDERRHKEDAARRAKDDAERRAKDDAERRARDEAEAKARAASASFPSIDSVAAPPPPAAPAAAAGGGIGDDLLADLDSFGKREEEEQRATEEAERKAKAEAERKAQEAAERRAKDDAERRAREEAEKQRRDEEERRAQEEAERKAREEEERLKQEEAERKRKAKDARAAKQATEQAARAAAAKGGDDIGVTDEDLDMDEVKRDQKVLAERARKLAREQPAVVVASGRPKSWGKPAAIALFVLLAGGVGVLHVMPVSTADYEKAATEALGAPVKIASARLSVITGIQMNFEGVSIGEAVKIRQVRAFPEVGSLFGARKSFSRVELEGASLSQSQLADAVLGKAAGENFRIGRVVVRQANLEGPLKLPPLEVEALVSGDGALQSLTLRGPDKLSVQLSPKGSEVGFEISAGSLALPFVPALTLSEFSMKGTANRQGVTGSEFDGRVFDGVVSGTARIRWGANWTVDGEVRARGVKVAVFAPALVSEGKVEGRGAYTMAGSTPANLFESARLQGQFKIEKGVLGSFDLTRALQTGGAQTGGRTVFSELTGQGVYDKGAVQITNVAIAAGAMNAGASLGIDANGGLSGRILADVKTPNQTLRATLNVTGKLQDPVIRK